MGFRAAIVGCGAQGRVISTFFTRDPSFDAVGLFDLRQQVCAEHLAKLGGNLDSTKHLEVGRLDAGDVDDVASKIGSYDVLVNAVIPRFNVQLMEASMKAGVHYVDMAFGPPYSNLDLQMSLSESFRDANLIALIGAGKSPGITNLLVAEAADMLDTLTAVRIRLYGEINASEATMTWSPKTLLEDCSISPAYISGSKLVRAPPFSGEEEYQFPQPIGRRRVWLHEHEEAYMFYRTLVPKGLKQFDLKLGAIENIKALFDLGLLDQPSVEAPSSSRIDVLASLLPQPPTQDELLEKISRGVIKGSNGVTVVEVDGVRNGSEARVLLWVEDPNILDVVKNYPMATDDSYVVGSACSALTKLVLSHVGDLEKGVLLPENLPRNIRREAFSVLAEQYPPITVNGRLECKLALSVENVVGGH